MSGSTDDGGSTAILRLGIDPTGVQVGADQAKAALQGVKTSAQQAAQSWDALTGAMDKTPGAAAPAAAAVAEVKQEATGATGGMQQAATAATNLGTALGGAKSAAQGAAEAIRQVNEATQRAAEAQARVNAFAGIQQRTQEEYDRRAADIAAYGEQLERLQRQYDPLYAVQQRHKEQLEGIANARKVNAISADVEAAAIKRAELATKAHTDALQREHQALTNTGGGMKLRADQLTNLFYQLQDVGVQLAGGQNPLMILVQQGPQAAGAVGGFGNALKMAASFINPLTVGVGLAVGGITAMVLASESQERALQGISAKLRSTRDDYLSLATTVREVGKDLARTSSLSGTDATGAATAIASSRDFTGGQAELERMTKLAADLAKVMGVDVPAAAKQYISAAIENPAAAARKAAEGGLFGFNDSLRRQVELMQASGDKAGAAQLVLDTYARRIGGAAEETTALGRAWNAVANGITSATQALAGYLEKAARQVLPSGPVSPIATQQDRITQLEAQLARLQAGDNPQAAPGRGAGRMAVPQAPGGMQPLLSQDQYGANAEGIRRLREQLAAEQARLTEMTPEGIRGVRIAPQLASITASSSPAQVRAAIEAQATLMGVPPSFAAGIGQTESGFRFMDPAKPGQILTSSAGAQGYMQLMPDTARGLKVDPTDPIQNIIGGLKLMLELAGTAGIKRDGQTDWTRVAVGYQGGPTRGAGDNWRPIDYEYINKVRRAGGTLTGAVADQAALYGQAEESLAGRDPRSFQIATRQAQLDQLGKAAALPGLDDAKVTQYREAMELLRAELVRLRDPQEEANRKFGDQSRLYGEAAGAARDLAAAEQRGRELALSQGKDATEQTLAGLQERQREQVRLKASADDLIANNARQIASEQAVAAVIAQGGTALRDLTARKQAEVDAEKTYRRGTAEYRAEVERLTASYIALAAVRADAASAQGTADNTRQIAMLETEVSLLGAGASERERALAAARALQSIQQRGGDPNSQASQGLIASAQQLAQARLDTDRIKAAYAEIGAFASNTFSKIGDSITEAFVQGRIETVKFGGVLKGVATQFISMFGRMALLNPLANSLLGQNLPTIFDAFSGGTSGGGAVGSGIGLIGGLASLFSGSTGTTTGSTSSGGMVVIPTAGGVGSVAPSYNGSSIIPGGASTGGGFSGLLSTGSSALSIGKTAFNWLFPDASLGSGASYFQQGMASVFGPASNASGAYNLGSFGNIFTGANNGMVTSGFGGIDSWLNQPGYGQAFSTATGTIVAPSTAGGFVSGAGGGFSAGTVADPGLANFGGGAEAAYAGQYSAGSGVQVGSTLGTQIGGGLGVLGGAYNIYQGVNRGGVGGAVQTAGGVAGAAGGALMMGGTAMFGSLAALGPYGLIAMAVLALISQFLPSQKPSNREGNASYNFDLNTVALGGQTGDKFSGANQGMAGGTLVGLVDMVRKTQDMLGYRAQGALTVGRGDRDGQYLTYTGPGGMTGRYGLGDEGSKDLARDAIKMVVLGSMGTMTEAVRDAVQHVGWDQALEPIMQQLAQIATVTKGGKSSGYQDTAARNIDWNSTGLQGGLQELQWVSDVYTKMVDGGAARQRSSYLSQIDQINAQWQEMVDHAERLGLATGELSTAWAAAIDDANAKRDEVLAGVTTNIAGRQLKLNGQDLAAQLLSFDVSAGAEQRNLSKTFFDQGMDADTTAFWVAQLKGVQDGERQQRIDEYNKAQAAWVRTSYAPMANGSNGANAYAQQLGTIDANFAALIETAAKLGYATTGLYQSWAKATETAVEQRNISTMGLVGGLANRRYRLAGDNQAAELGAFDISALQERFTMKGQMEALGFSPDAVKMYLLELEDIQGKERLAIAKKYSDQIIAEEDGRRQQVANVINSLSSYARGLQTGDLSPLSGQAQYDLQRSQYDALSTKALGGNIEALGNLPSAADAFLRASRDINGSGEAYVKDFDRVLAALESAAQIPTDTLTASVLTAETRTQTEVLKGALDTLTAEVVSLRREVAQGSNTPARAAA